MRQRLGVPLLAHPGPHAGGMELDADRWLEDGDTVAVGNHTLHVRYAPGHIGDQICFVIANDNRVIVGDTIFANGPGKTWNKDQFQMTLETLRTVVLSWPDDTICYPGHGPAFRLGDSRAAIEAFLAKDHGDFTVMLVGYVDSLSVGWSVDRVFDNRNNHSANLTIQL